MRVLFCLLCFTFTSLIKADETNGKNWLLWYETKAKLPYSSSLTIYPPVTLYASENKIIGYLATSYSFNNKKNPSDKYLIIVTDSSGIPHFLSPKRQSIGFANESGIILSLLSSSSFQDGEVLIQFYKDNSPQNKQKLIALKNEDVARKREVKNAISNIRLSKPAVGERWDISSLTLSGIKVENIVKSSPVTIIQLYSQHCGFCQKAIPQINKLHKNKHINVIGMAGSISTDELKKHILDKEINYDFINYEGKYSESALLDITGQQGFPTYLILDSTKVVKQILIGTPTLMEWINTQGFVDQIVSR